MPKKFFLPTDLPYFFSDRYRKQTIFFSWPNMQIYFLNFGKRDKFYSLQAFILFSSLFQSLGVGYLHIPPPPAFTSLSTGPYHWIMTTHYGLVCWVTKETDQVTAATDDRWVAGYLFPPWKPHQRLVQHCFWPIHNSTSFDEISWTKFNFGKNNERMVTGTQNTIEYKSPSSGVRQLFLLDTMFLSSHTNDKESPINQKWQKKWR